MEMGSWRLWLSVCGFTDREFADYGSGMWCFFSWDSCCRKADEHQLLSLTVYTSGGKKWKKKKKGKNWFGCVHKEDLLARTGEMSPAVVQGQSSAGLGRAQLLAVFVGWHMKLWGMSVGLSVLEDAFRAALTTFLSLFIAFISSGL